ncbi:MAG: hypothetical protein KDI03_12665, partial [Anaerolineae bacterium]|nr:hypothetical protein [Anaerolineae bacterium]
RANIKFRICLRVEEVDTSREMLRRSDAAFLPSGMPGRGYLQVGNEGLELTQIAYTGETYPYAEVKEGGKKPKFYDIVVDLANELLEGEAPRTPWPPFLPTKLTFADPLMTDYLDDDYKPLITLGQTDRLSLNPFLEDWLHGRGRWSGVDWNKTAMRGIAGLLDDPFGARQMPLVTDLTKGHAVIFGASGWGKTTFIRTLAISLAATHSPNHLHMYILDLGGRNLSALDALPHVGAVINPDEEGYKERVEQLLRELDDLVDGRKTILADAGAPDLYKYNTEHPEQALPAVLVAIDNFLEFKETFGETTDNVESVMDKFVDLARQAKPYGVHFVITINQLNSLSMQLYNVFTERLTLKLGDATDYRAIVGGFVTDLPDIPGRGYVKIALEPLSFQVAMPLDLGRRSGQQELLNENKEIQGLGQIMQEYIAESGREYLKPVRIDALPRSILFKQILARQHGLEVDETFLAALRDVTRQQWADSLDPNLADWLRVTIGTVSGNRLREMHLEAKTDGVHGLIAGGTGSGKSELLMTLIVGLALRYDPSILNFVLVDYKGGGAFAPFDNLPHVVDTVTNLNKSAVRRMFTAIGAEMDRRMKLCVETSTSNIVEYRSKGLHRTHKPFPHLFIIIDEYAEMITDNPEFKDELDRITRVGRSIGVNLLLAAQRPVGVTDQMRANIKFRICLRVEGVDTSREMLRRSDAAFLPSGMPGRGYLQIGNENIELMQVAYTGETYPYGEEMEGGKKPKFYDVVVNLINELLAETGRDRPRTPWPPFLPAATTLDAPLVTGYLDAATRPLITLGQTNRLALNPFAADWLDGAGKWHGMNWENSAMRAIAGVLDDPYNARILPLVIDFTRGHAVMFGASGWGKTTFLRTLIASLASTHSPDEFQAHILDLGGRNLEVMKALPHVGTVILPDERGYEERVQQLLREINDIVDMRKRLFSEAGVATLYEYNALGRPVEPAILLAIDNFAEYVETFGNPNNPDDENNLLSALVALARQAKAYGVHIVVTANRFNVLTSKLYSLFTERLTLRLSDAQDYPGIVGGHVEVDEIPGRGMVRVARVPLDFQIAVIPGAVDENGKVGGEARIVRALGERMNAYIAGSEHVYKEPLRIDALPKSSSYRQVLNEMLELDAEQPFMAELERATRHVWAHNHSAEHADWLQATLGITSGMRKRTLQLEAKKDGVHGLIAGGTGSGKSEMLMTLICGLALNYPSDILNFVLVDYKGGGAFKPFERMPHVVDIVTNLNKAAVHRMFTAINAEIRRRQGLNAETGTKDIVDYRKRGLHLTGPAYPHLFIIIDEYAEMIDDNPEYRAELESITRVGRAQGVNLLLASQRPKGVTDQMRANIKLRLCLRVEQIDTSREMLRRPDAALLPNGLPGRGYLQIGNDPLELIQVSWTGETQPDDREPSVLWPEHEGPEMLATEEPPKLYDAVASMALELSGGQMAPKPWPAFLPTQISLQSPIRDAQRNRTFTLTTAVSDWLNGDWEPSLSGTETLWPGVAWRGGEDAGLPAAMQPVAGLVDDPAEARQIPLSFDLSRDHLVAFGDSGWGKTSFLRTLITSLATTHSPNELHVYVLDLGGRNFRSLEELPHIGAVIYADEETFDERLMRLLGKIERIVDERQMLLSDAAANNLWEFNERYPEQALPAVLVAIDNFAELHENYELLIDSTILPLVRRSLSAGVCFAVTANIPNNMPSKLFALLGQRITFKQANSDRYMDIVGRGALEIEDIPGRGYIRIGRRPLLLQAALPVGIFAAEDPSRSLPSGRDTLVEADELRRLAGNMRTAIEAGKIDWQHRPDPIDILPEVVPLVDLLKRVPPSRSQRIQAVLGQLGSLQPGLCDLKRLGPHFVIMGPPLSGKSTLLYNWIFSLADRYSPDQVAMVIIDTQRKLTEYGGQRKLEDRPHVLAAVSEPEVLEGLVEKLKTEGEHLVAGTTEREL